MSVCVCVCVCVCMYVFLSVSFHFVLLYTQSWKLHMKSGAWLSLRNDLLLPPTVNEIEKNFAIVIHFK